MSRNKKYFKLGIKAATNALTYVDKLLLNRATDEEKESFDNGKRIGQKRLAH